MNSMIKNVEEIYPLSPVQEGILYHSELAPSSGVYVEQFIFELTGKLKPDDFRNAWSEIIKRHAVFRTQFANLDQEKPRQVVLKQVELPWQEEDWKQLSPNVQEEYFSALLSEDRAKGFDTAHAPLMRICLIQLEPERYQFVWTHHHAIVDGWSWPIVIKELFTIYGAISQLENIDLPQVLPYRNYIRWLGEQDLQQAEKYWCQYLQGYSAPTPLTMENTGKKPTNTAPTLPQKCQTFLDKELASKIDVLARKEKITVNVLMQAAWALLLSRYSGEHDITFGKVVSGRPPELEGASTIVGPFINTLPLRVYADPEAQILPWLKKLHQSQIEQIPYQTTPLSHIQSWSEISGWTSLFNSIFVFQNYPIDSEIDEITAAAGLSITDFYAYEQTHYPLTAMVSFSGEAIFQILYDPTLFNSSAIELLVEQYQVLLEGIIETPQQTLDSLSVVTQLEKERQLVDWNNTKTGYPNNKCVHALFEKQVENTPDAIAVEMSGETLTYAELNQRSNQLAHHLIKQGIEPDARIGLAVERSFELAIGILGILKAGGAYVPLDINYPKERLSYMLKQAEVKILLSQKTLRDELPVHPNIIDLDSNASWTSQDKGEKENPSTKVRAKHLAYVIYTSGSTGRPKAVAMPHLPLANLVHWQLDNSKCSVGSRTLQFSSYSFDVSFQELFSTWCSGGTLVLISENMRKDSLALWRFITETKINRVFMPFIALQQLAEAQADKKQSTTDPVTSCDLKEVITAGEQLQITPFIRDLFEKLDGCTLYNQYGPSESHVCTALELKGPAHSWEPLPTIGTPIANDCIYILDSSLQPVPTGGLGEIYIGGVGLARGYLGRDDLTTEKFVQNPFGKSHDDRLYRTGDLGRYRSDSSIEYKGRIDNQVKIRGFRIELGEIECLLARIPNIQEAVVTLRQHDQNTQDKYLAAYVVQEPGLKQDRAHLQKILRSKLPGYMVPSVFVFLDALPLTPSGKIDRRALPAPDENALITQEYKSPRTDVEKELVDIWASILNLTNNKIGIQDNFFDLGGHSLLATRLIGQVRKILHVEIEISDLFKLPTIETLAEKIDKQIHQIRLAQRLGNQSAIADIADIDEMRI